MWKKWREKYLIEYWNPFYAVLLLAVLSTYYFGLLHTHWAITGELTRWGGSIAEAMGIEVKDWSYFRLLKFSERGVFERVEGVMLIGMFLGALSATLLANRFAFVFPHNLIRIAQALLGGIIAGFGARLGMGCNLASFFTGIPQFSLHAWVFTLLSLLGVYLGVKVITMPFFQSKIELKVGAFCGVAKKRKAKKDTLFLGIVMSFLSLGFGMYFFSQGSSSLGVASFFGMAFGFIIAKAQVCFTSAFRDLFLFGRDTMAKAIVFGMFLSTLGVLAFILLGVAPKISWVGLNVVLGGLLFGFGIVIAGGCECGWIYRSMRGQVLFLIVGVGNIIGSVLLAYMWGFVGESLATSYPKINLLEVFGNYGGLVANCILLLGLLGIVYALSYKKESK